MPLLISVLGVPPILAVGSDAVVNFITRIGAGALHWHQGNVNLRMAFNLACGSIPGAVLGVMLLARIRALYGSGVNDFLRITIAILLIVIPITYLLRARLPGNQSDFQAAPQSKFSFGVLGIGFVAGIMVGSTSIGSGSVILLLLLVLYRYSPSTMVGTDIIHGILLAGLTGALQFRMGNVDPKLAAILIGAIPGSLLGAYATRYLPAQHFKTMLCTILVVVGERMLWISMPHAN